MIRTFDSKKKLLFAPKAFLNAVARWLLNVRSASGTIRITNTANPTPENGPSLDVDAPETAKKLDPILAERYPKRGDRRLLMPSLGWTGGKLGVDEEWITNEINKNLGVSQEKDPEHPDAEKDNREVMTLKDADEDFEGAFEDWKREENKVLKLRVYMISGEKYARTFHPVDLVFSQTGLLAEAKKTSGKSIFIGA